MRCGLSLAAKVKGGWMHAQKEDKSGGEVIWKKQSTFKVGISQDRESLLGKAYGQCVGGACWPWGSLINS